jgi:hypothetical protein
MTTAFLFLVTFAMVNARAQRDEPPLEVERLSRSETVAEGIAQSARIPATIGNVTTAVTPKRQ